MKQDDLLYIQYSKFQYNENFVINKHSEISLISRELYSNTVAFYSAKNLQKVCQEFQKECYIFITSLSIKPLPVSKAV
jgi:hypothetical protein